MDPPSLFPPAAAAAAPCNHPDSANSSPRSHPDSAWDDHTLPPVPGAKLRLMCSYGGHIIPRPHDKTLCYVGGDTRIVVFDRHSNLSELQSRLSHTLLNGRHFTLKYQLPTEDLDSLILLATDEDLENMIEEYDRTTSASPLKPSRLRLFLFPTKPETAASMGSLLDNAKSETWFFEALNGSGLLPRGLSESAAIYTLVELNLGGDSCADLEAQNESNNSKQIPTKGNINVQDVEALDSTTVVETSSSFGSSSSSPSMANLPPIRIRSEDYLMVGLDEQFSHVKIAPSFANEGSPPIPYVAAVKSGGGVGSAAGGGENRLICDDEKSDQGTVAPSGLRKPPLPLQPVQRKLVDIHNLPSPDSKHAGGYNLPSPDSVASDCSIASAGSLSKHAIYQDASQFINRETLVPPLPQTDPKISNNIIQDPTSQIPPQQNQQHFIPTTHYIHHPPLPISSYYPMYLHPPTQQPDPQHPMYVLPQAQPANRPLTPPLPPVYPAKTEMAANMHGHQMGGAGGGPVLVQVPAHQFQQHYIGVSQMPPPPQSNAGGGTASTVGTGYGFEYTNLTQDQGYYAQPVAASTPFPPQFQTMTPAAAVMFTQASSLITPDINAQQS